MMLRPFVAALLAAALAAQEAPAWKLPLRGAAEYRRTYAAASDVAGKAAEAQALDAKGKVPDDLLPDLLPVPWLCQGELADDQRAIGDPPRDLRDVLRFVAGDLRLGGAVKLRAHRIVPFGDLVLTGKVDAMAADGAQSFALAVATEDLEVLPGESKASMAKFVRDLCKHRAKGELRMRRTFDAQRGALGSWQGELSLVFEEGKGVWRKLVVRDAYPPTAAANSQGCPPCSPAASTPRRQQRCRIAPLKSAPWRRAAERSASCQKERPARRAERSAPQSRACWNEAPSTLAPCS